MAAYPNVNVANKYARDIIDGKIVACRAIRLACQRHFDDLKKLYFTAMIINEKIDLEIANQRFVVSLGNTEENLLQLKQIIQKLNDYYRQFLREK